VGGRRDFVQGAAIVVEELRSTPQWAISRRQQRPTISPEPPVRRGQAPVHFGPASRRGPAQVIVAAV